MLELGLSGSVRGVVSDGYPYLDKRSLASNRVWIRIEHTQKRSVVIL